MEKKKMSDLLLYYVIRKLRDANYTSYDIREWALEAELRIGDERYGAVLGIRTKDDLNHFSSIDYKKSVFPHDVDGLVDKEFMELARTRIKYLIEVFDLIEYDMLDNRIREIEEEIACLH